MLSTPHFHAHNCREFIPWTLVKHVAYQLLAHIPLPWCLLAFRTVLCSLRLSPWICAASSVAVVEQDEEDGDTDAGAEDGEPYLLS